MSRADTPEHQRRDFSLYVDEFQNFATESFATILSEARKYRLSLTIANQYLAQMDEATAAAVFGNVGSLLVFQVGASDAEALADQLGGGVTPQDLLALPRFTAYVRLAYRRDAQPAVLDGDDPSADRERTLRPLCRHPPHIPAPVRPSGEAGGKRDSCRFRVRRLEPARATL